MTGLFAAGAGLLSTWRKHREQRRWFGDALAGLIDRMRRNPPYITGVLDVTLPKPKASFTLEYTPPDYSVMTVEERLDVALARLDVLQEQTGATPPRWRPRRRRGRPI